MKCVSECPMCGEISLETITKSHDEGMEIFHVQCGNPKCNWNEWIESSFPTEIVGRSLATVALKILKSRGIELTEEQEWVLSEDLECCLVKTLKQEGITEKVLYSLGIGIRSMNGKEVIQ